MNIIIKATKTTLTPAIQQVIIDKLSVLEDFIRTEDKIRVECEVSPHHAHGEDVHRVEVHISPAGYFAQASGGDFYEALDLLIPKIREQMVKNKDRQISLRRRLGSAAKRGSLWLRGRFGRKSIKNRN